MVRCITLFFIAVLLTVPTGAQQSLAQKAGPPSAADAAAIRGVIEAQIAAFRRDDGAAAYGYASPMIQRMFPNPAIFMDMVRSGYRPVYRPRSFQFQDLGVIDGQVVQRVLFVGPDGQPVIGLYMMQRQGNGRWRINGVHLLAVPGESAGNVLRVG